jgi:Ca2+-binding EF-hand superfamily protein
MMRDLLERIKELDRDVNQNEVEDILHTLPSIATLEEAVSRLKAEKKKILTEDLLEWMMENDMTNLETEEFEVAIKTYVSAKIQDPDAAFNWLTENQYADLIKTSVDFPKGEFSSEVQHILEEMGLSFSRKDGVHPQTLKKVISDRLKAGESLPDEDEGFKVHYYDECQVKGK